MHKLKLPLDADNINKLLLEYNYANIDILFTVKGNTIYPWTLRKIKKKYPNIKIISWSLDDMYAWHNRSLYYTLGIKYYDLVVTTKSYNIKELYNMGAKQVLFQYQAYSKDLHKPYKCEKNSYNEIDVLFIGYFEEERYKSMLFLAKNGIKVDIYGPAWDKNIELHKNLTIHNKVLIGKEYAKALSCAKISLCFLRKMNRDLHTSRSMEIPACGGFMIAERTNEHLALFEEDKEAVYFDTNEELLKKVKYYLKNEEERKKIAKAGYERARNSGYSYDDRVKEILQYVKEKL
jgi:spore maturation protein CgeB